MKKLILASASPRRRELLEMLGLEFDIHPALSEAEPDPGLPVGQAISRVAAAKAQSVADELGTELPILAADTIVYAGSRILGKPGDKTEAAEMLRLLSGSRHTVYTGVALLHRGRLDSAFEKTDVYFRPISEDEIAAYVASGEPMDKAGAYGAQGLAALFIERIDGDFFNVIGLPLCLTGRLLSAAGFGILREKL